jgi:hypothetical protein
MSRKSLAFAACAAALSLAGGNVLAQPEKGASLPADVQDSALHTCMYQGAPSTSREPVGDRTGHDLHEVHYTCSVKGGAMDGAVVSAHGVYEWNGTEGRLLSGGGIARKPGSVAVFTTNTGKGSIVMQDGKPIGARNAGKATYTFGSGAASGWSGKTFSYATRPGTNGQFFVEATMDPSP